mmetsp:Transcript_25025/g.58714  ORF Transcript_25025/g.58714 Transcript_25025/m.58714 type:complete len:271 (+) Transcript_25025:24-836(+)
MSMWVEPIARMSMGSSPAKNRVMSRSWTAMSAKMPPPPLTYDAGGGAGSREHSLIIMGSPTSFDSTACLTRSKFWSNRRCNPIMSLTPASLQALMASTVSARSVAMGFSQKTCFLAAAQALIWSAWNCDGEQIQTASTSGSLMTSMASLENRAMLYWLAAASAFETVGFETMTGTTPGAFVMASRCTKPMRPIPITPTLTVLAPPFISTPIERHPDDRLLVLLTPNELVGMNDENAATFSDGTNREDPKDTMAAAKIFMVFSFTLAQKKI